MKAPAEMEYLFTGHEYRSPAITPSRLRRAFPSVVFYTRLARLVLWGASEARKGRLSTEKRVWGTNEIIRCLESTGVSFNIENTGAFRELDSPCVFVSNHMSTMETFILTSIIEPYREITYVIKESLTKYPVFKHIMISRDPVVVTRINPREDFRKVLREGAERLSRNISVVVFPQTTRSPSFRPEEFNSIGVKLASHAGVPVVPVALKTDAWGTNRRFVKEFGPIEPSRPVRVCFGEPIPPAVNSRDQQAQVIRFIGTKMGEWAGSDTSPSP